VDVAHTFIGAVELICKNHKYYDLILLDRNLSDSQNSLAVEDLEQMVNMLQEIGQSYSEDRLLDFYEREGDLLLQVLLSLSPDYQQKIYFLTANVKDDLRDADNLNTMLEMHTFRRDHIIEKGTSQEDIICDITSKLWAFKIMNDYPIECSIIRKRLSEDDLNEFVQMISYYNKDKHREFVFYLRKLLDNLLHSLAFMMGEPHAPYWNEHNRKQLVIKSFIKGFKDRRTNKVWGIEAYDERTNTIGYNSIIRNACLGIFEITSDCGVHDLSKAIDLEGLTVQGLSKYTMITLLNQMRDVIIWYDKALSAIESK